LLNLGYIEPKFEQFLGETSRFFLPILTLILWFLYILSDEVHKYQAFQSIIIALKKFLKM
jgi:hypothetical protein